MKITTYNFIDFAIKTVDYFNLSSPIVCQKY